MIFEIEFCIFTARENISASEVVTLRILLSAEWVATFIGQVTAKSMASPAFIAGYKPNAYIN